MHRSWVRASLLALAFLALAVSGCAGKGKTPATDAPANFDNLGLEATATTGIIRGIALDDAIRPLAGVQLNTTGADGLLHNTTSAVDGAYGFDGLAPGTYFVKAHKAGYLPIQVSVDVVAGVAEPPVTKILMKSDPSSLPYVAVYKFDAFIGCSVTSPSVSAAACDIVGPVKDATNNKFLTNVDADKPPQWIQSEAVWESTQSLGSALSLSITDFSSGPQLVVNRTDGPSPIYISINETVARAFNFGVNNTITIRLFSTTAPGTDVVPEEQVHQAYASSVYGPLNSTGLPGTYQGVADTANDNDPTGLEIVGNPFGSPDCIKYPVLFDSCYSFGGVGITVNQRVDVFTHIFYGYAPPPDWRFSATGEAPQPPL